MVALSIIIRPGIIQLPTREYQLNTSCFFVETRSQYHIEVSFTDLTLQGHASCRGANEMQSRRDLQIN